MAHLDHVNSHEDFVNKTQKLKKAYLLLYKKGTAQSTCAFENLVKVTSVTPDVAFFAADVTSVRDIHTRYAVTSAPTLLEFTSGKFTRSIKGCHEPDYYKTVVENKVFTATTSAEGKTQKRVTVYSTPSCPHCNTLKEHLRKNNIRFTDIDVSKDQAKAQELVRKTGQQGVPQTDINGQYVLGFDKKRVNELLGIKG
jgi:glutaredoxin-like YruB-family protein